MYDSSVGAKGGYIQMIVRTHAVFSASWLSVVFTSFNIKYDILVLGVS